MNGRLGGSRLEKLESYLNRLEQLLLRAEFYQHLETEQHPISRLPNKLLLRIKLPAVYVYEVCFHVSFNYRTA